MHNRIGTLTIDGDRATITFVRYLPYPIDAVWAAITDPATRAEWFGATSIEPWVGGRIETMPSEPPAPPRLKRVTGRILVWEPPKVLEHEWRQGLVEDGVVVRYELAEQAGGTVLTFTHRGLGVGNAHGFIPGEHAFLDRLDAVLGAQPVPAWADRYAALAPLYPAWRAPRDGSRR